MPAPVSPISRLTSYISCALEDQALCVHIPNPPDADSAHEILSHGQELAEVIGPVDLAAFQEGLEKDAFRQKAVKERRESVEIEGPLADGHGQRDGQAGVIVEIGESVTPSLFDFLKDASRLFLHEDIGFSH